MTYVHYHRKRLLANPTSENEDLIEILSEMKRPYTVRWTAKQKTDLIEALKKYGKDQDKVIEYLDCGKS